MVSVALRVLMLGLAPIVLNACVEIEPATGSPTPAAPLVGADLGSSGRLSQIAGLAGEGEGHGRTEPNPSRTGHDSMSGMSHGSLDHGSMPDMDHGSMPGMDHAAGRSMKMAHSGHAHVQATGMINSVHAAARKLNVTHDPIPTIGWPSMTMDFAVAPSVDLSAVTPGTRVNFDMEQGQGGMYVIQSIRPAAAPAGGTRR